MYIKNIVLGRYKRKKNLKNQIDTNLNLNNYLLYYNYFVEIINTESKGKKDKRQYLKLITKQYKNSIHKLGIKFKRITNFDISFQYQKFNSYIFGYIKAWPFTSSSSINFIGGKFNFSSKLNFNRYIIEVKNRFKMKKY